MKMEAVKIPIGWATKGGKKLQVPNEGAAPGDVVTWEWRAKDSKDPFFILFPDESPFAEMELRGTGGTVSATVIYNPEGRGAKRFKYIVAGVDSKDMTLHVLDPDIIISKPGKKY